MTDGKVIYLICYVSQSISIVEKASNRMHDANSTTIVKSFDADPDNIFVESHDVNKIFVTLHDANDDYFYGISGSRYESPTSSQY